MSDNLIRESSLPETDALREELAQAKQKIAELTAELTDSTLRWKFALEGSGDGVWDWNVVTNEVYFSAQWKKMLGFEEDELSNSLAEWDARVHPEDKQRVYADIQNHFEGQNPTYRNEHRVLCKDGTFKWILDRGKIVERTGDGKPLRMVGTHTDISDTKTLNKELKDNAEFFNSMFVNSVVVMLIIDPETGTIVEANNAAERFYGYSAEELRTLNIKEINQYTQSQVSFEMRQAQISRNNHFIFPHKLKGGEVRVVEVYSTPVKKNNKNLLFSIIQDITSRLQAESILKENEEKYRNFVANSSDGFLLTDEQGKIIEWNAAQEHITGFAAEDVIGRNAAEMQMNLGPAHRRTPEHYAMLRSMFQNFFSTGTGDFLNTLMDIPIVAKYGEEKIIQQICFRIKTTKGFCLGAVTRDVTGIKEQETILLDNEELFRTMFEAAPIGVAQIDANARFIRSNSTLSRIVGYSKRELEDFSLFNITDQVDMGHINSLLQKMIAGSTSAVTFESRCIHKNGTILWVVISCAVITRKDDTPFFITFINDITARKRAELAVLENEEKLQKIFEILPIGITITDRTGNLIDGNKASEHILGLRKSEQFRRNAGDGEWEIIRPDGTPMPASEFASVRALKENKTIMNMKMGLLKQSGKITWLNVCATPLPLSNYGVVITYSDITEQVANEQELLEVNNQLSENKILLEEANKAKDKFISIIAHDLRAPFSAFLGLSEILAGDTKAFSYAEINEMAKKMNISAVNTLQLLSDLLDWGRLNTNTMKYNLQWSDAEDIILRATEILRSSCGSKEITLTLNIEPGLKIYTDKNLLSNVVRNLLSNAIKFSFRGNEIKITGLSENNNVIVSVEDRGIGMTPEELSKLFIAGQNSTSPGTENEKGSGLGLLVCKEFIEKMGGTLTAKSEKYAGTIFTITIPQNSPATKE